MATEPLLDVDNVVTVSMTAVVTPDGSLGDYSDAVIDTQEIKGEFDATITQVDSITYSYTIPWENRTGIGNLSQYGSVQYDKHDTIVFTTPLTTTQVLAKKLFPYITYIDTGSAVVDPSFSNMSQVADNFQDANYTLPASSLTVIENSNSTLGAPPVPFNATLAYIYGVSLEK